MKNINFIFRLSLYIAFATIAVYSTKDLALPWYVFLVGGYIIGTIVNKLVED